MVVGRRRRTGRGHGTRCSLLLLGVLLLTAYAPIARAHPDVDEGLRLAADLELEAALEAFSRALESGELTRDEVVQVLTERALLLHALRNAEGLRETFTWLAAIAPEHMLGMRAPPDLVAMWTSVRDQARGQLSVRIEHKVEPGRLRARLVLGGSRPDGLDASLALRVDGGEWEVPAGASVDRELPGGGDVDLYANVRGLGGLLLANDGSEQTPLHLVVPAAGASGSALALGDQTDPQGQDDTRSRRKRRWLIGTGAVVVAAIVLTSALVATKDEKARTDISPMVMGF